MHNPKILICGKGGSGKSAVTTLLAKSLARRGYRVLVVDADESNPGLYRQLGVEPPRELMELFGGKREFRKIMKDESLAEHFKEPWSVEKLPPGYVSYKNGVYLVVVGKIKEYGEGCACPHGVLLGNLLKNLVFPGPVLVDCEAGVEHFGRGVEESVDMVLFIADPTFESIMLAKKVEGMCRQAGKDMYIVLNKVDKEAEEFMLKHLGENLVLSSIPYKQEIMRKYLRGEELDLTIREIEEIVEKLLSYTKACPHR